MAARSRPRGGQIKEEFDEERSIWNSIKADGRRVDQYMKESEALQDKILDLTAQQTARISRGEEPSSRIDNELEQALRDNIRNLEQAQALLQAVDGGNDISTQIGILAALRASPEISSVSRAASVGHGKTGRDRHGKRKLTDSVDDRDSIATDSPGGPSPKVVISSQKDRLVAKTSSSRAGSVPAAREGSVKMEDDKDDLGKGKKTRSPSKSKSSRQKNIMP